MNDPTVPADIFSEELAATPVEIALSLRLLKAFLSLPPEQQPEIIELIEQRAMQRAALPPARDDHLSS
jgi:hypothetical protein